MDEQNIGYGYNDIENIFNPLVSGGNLYDRTLGKSGTVFKYSLGLGVASKGAGMFANSFRSRLSNKYISNRSKLFSINGYAGTILGETSDAIKNVTGFDMSASVNSLVDADKFKDTLVNKYVDSADLDKVYEMAKKNNPNFMSKNEFIKKTSNRARNIYNSSSAKVKRSNMKYTKSAIKDIKSLRVKDLPKAILGNESGTVAKSLIRPNRHARSAAAIKRSMQFTTGLATEDSAIFNKIFTKSINRMRLKSFASTAGIVTTAALLAKPVISYGAKKLENTYNRLSHTLHNLTQSEFGTGNIIDNSRIASERQKQMTAIHNAGINARGLLGQEASYYTR